MKKIFNAGALLSYAEDYVLMCKERAGGVEVRFPNLAGFARSLGVGVETLKNFQSKYPDQYGAVLALFEDEALNCSKSPTVLSAYLKERLDFGEKKEGGDSFEGEGTMRIVFEHDIGEDGK